MTSVFVVWGLPLKLEVGFFHLFERELHALTGRRLKGDHTRGEALERSCQMALIFYRLAQDHLDFLADEALELARLTKFALDAGGADFECITSSRDNVLDVQNGADLMRDVLAVAVRDPRGLVDKNAQNSTPAAAQEFHIDNLDALTGADSFSDLMHSFYNSLAVSVRHESTRLWANNSARSPIKKWACAHFIYSPTVSSIHEVGEALLLPSDLKGRTT